MDYRDILSFWFEDLSPEQWFARSESLDLKMVEKFIVIHSEAINGELYHWRESPLGRLAEIILIDQFSRNIYRDDPKAFAYDAMALALAQETIRQNAHTHFSLKNKHFLFLPFMHSESPLIHQHSIKYFSTPGLGEALTHASRHKSVIDRFGRYPERNKILGRINSIEEDLYLMKKNNGPIFFPISHSSLS